MNKIFALLFLVVALLSISGCGISRQLESRAANDKLMQLNVGMSRDEVLSVLGKPYKREVYGEDEFLIYETNFIAKAEKEQFTPILIKSGKVAGWGRNYYDDAIKSKIDADIKVKTQ